MLARQVRDFSGIAKKPYIFWLFYRVDPNMRNDA